MSAKKTSRKARLGLLFLSLAFTLVAAELGLRMVGYKSPHVVTPADRGQCRMAPNNEFIYRGYLDGMFSDFATPVKLNSLGFNDVEHSAGRAMTNTFRLMVIGDSYVAALSCPLETTFFRCLEERLNREDPLGRGSYEVIAFGQGNQAQEKEARYVKQFGPVYKPDAVLLLFFCGNDFMENSPETFRAAAGFATMYMRTVAPKKLALFDKLYKLRWLRLNGLVAEAVTTFYADNLPLFAGELKKDDLVSPELGVYRVPLAPEWERAYARTAGLLAQLKAEVGTLGVPLLIAGLSGPQAIGDVGQRQAAKNGGAGFDPSQPARWLAGWCETNDVPFCDLGPALAAAGKRKTFWPHDGHLNPFGNKAIVEPILKLVVGQARK